MVYVVGEKILTRSSMCPHQANNDLVRCGGFVQHAAHPDTPPTVLQLVALWEQPCWGGGVLQLALARRMYRADETVFGSREPSTVVELCSSQHMLFGVPVKELAKAVEVDVRPQGAVAAGRYVCHYEYDHLHMSLRGLTKLSTAS